MAVRRPEGEVYGGVCPGRDASGPGTAAGRPVASSSRAKEDDVESPTATITGSDWKALADELASALRATILRNPTVTSYDWDRARTALERYESAGGQTGTVPAAELPEEPPG